MATNLTPLDKACSTAASVASAAIKVLIDLDNRISALKRAVLLLRGSADFLQDFTLPQLPQISAIDLATYASLQAACPMFNLPTLNSSSLNQLPGIKQLTDLRSMVLNAYQRRLDEMENTALGAIDQLQRQLDRHIHDALQIASPVIGLIDCVCQGAQTVSDAVEAKKAQSVWKAVTGAEKPTLIDTHIVVQRNQMLAAKAALQTALL